ncbi:MAG: LON peptidase substrate-binding domain-containing protein [Rhodovarius sp.]|nr:LON peptidase substrate-binding domain-containing protein [Rhodovarius sp.]
MTAAPFTPAFEDLPEEIPVFPLAGALLLPHGRLPLNIFEPRYLAMVEDALAAGRMFGMLQGDPSRPRDERGTAVYSVGCLGRISSFSETEDGRYLITLTGLLRYRVREELPMRRGYRRMRVDYSPYRADLLPLPTGDSIPRPQLIEILRPYFRSHGIEVNWEAIEKTPEALLVNTLAMVCPFSVAEKQALLEAPDPAARAGLLATLVRIGAHGDGPEGRGLPS